MLAEERKIKIIELLSHQNTISVNEIGKVLNATSVTIRKDLSELESEGKLQRIHGGAIAIEKVGEIFKDKDLASDYRAVCAAKSAMVWVGQSSQDSEYFSLLYVLWRYR